MDTEVMSYNGLKDYALEWLSYEEDTGKLFWKKSSKYGTRKVGREAGKTILNGYHVIKLLGKPYRAHRVIFLLKTGRFPTILDHINRCRTDNRWCNLREVTCSQNCLNRTLSKRNKTGVTGVYFLKSENVFTVTHGKLFIGRSKDFFEAICMRKSEELKYE